MAARRLADAGAARRTPGRGGDRARRQQHLGARRDSIRRQALSITRLRGRSRRPRSGCSSAGRSIRIRRTTSGRTAVRSSGRTAWRIATPSTLACFVIPTNGSLWLTYGSYFGYIRLVEINPKTGKRLYPERKPIEIAINGEASIMIFRDGWHYLLMTRGRAVPARTPATTSAWAGRARSRVRSSTTSASTCCRAEASCFSRPAAATSAPATSACSISVTACRSSPCTTRRISIEAASACSTSGRSSGVTAGRSPETTSRKARIRSSRRGRERRSSLPCRGRPWADCAAAAAAAAPAQEAGEAPEAATSSAQPDTRTGSGAGLRELAVGPHRRPHVAYMVQAQQKWAVTPVANAGGYPGSSYFKITIAGTDRALAATADRELVVLPAFTGVRSNCGGSISCRRHVSRDAEVRSGYAGTMGALGHRQQHADTRQVHPDSDRYRWSFKTP